MIYATFLLLVLLYLFVRRRGHPDPRAEMYRALAGLHELVDNNLDTRELEILLARLEVARRADQPHVAGLAAALYTYLLALLLSLTGVILLSFYLDKFRAVITALLQFGVLLLILAYRRWYLKEGVVDIRYEVDTSRSSDVDLTSFPMADTNINASGSSRVIVDPSGRLDAE